MELLEKIIAVRFAEKVLEKIEVESKPTEPNPPRKGVQDEYVEGSKWGDAPDQRPTFDLSFWAEPLECPIEDISNEPNICIDESEGQVCGFRNMEISVDVFLARMMRESVLISMVNLLFPQACSAPSDMPTVNYSEEPEPICKIGDAF